MTRSASLPSPWSPVKAVIADLDGVVYRGEAPIPDAVAAFQRWQAAGIPCRFVTNNSTRLAVDFAAKLRRLGVAATPEQVVTSSGTTARYMQSRWPAGTAVYALGAPALTQALTEAGFVVTDRAPAVVVTGLDRDLTYDRLRTAVHAIHAGATLVATNADPMLPVETGFDPGAGSILAAVVTATGATPIVIGKPEVPMILAALADLGTLPADTIMIGDQISTDILAGQRAGLRAVLVTTGIRNDGPQAATPDLVVASLLDLPMG